MNKSSNYLKKLSVVLVVFLSISLLVLSTLVIGELRKREIFLTTDSSNSAQAREVLHTDSEKKVYLINMPQLHSFNDSRDLINISELDVKDASGNSLKKIILPFSTKRVLVFTPSENKFLTLNYQIKNWGEIDEGDYNYIFSVNDRLSDGILIHKTFTNGYVKNSECQIGLSCKVIDIDQEVVYEVSSMKGKVQTKSEVVWNQEYVGNYKSENGTQSLLKVYYFNAIAGVVMFILGIYIFDHLRGKYGLVVRKRK